MKRLCDYRNIALTVILIPDEMQVSRPLQSRVIAASGLGAASFDFALPNRRLRAKLEELKIDYIDLTPEFISRSLNETLYRPNDPMEYRGQRIGSPADPATRVGSTRIG